MPQTDAVAWPPPPIATERLVLRESEARDRAAVIEMRFQAYGAEQWLGVWRPATG